VITNYNSAQLSNSEFDQTNGKSGKEKVQNSNVTKLIAS